MKTRKMFVIITILIALFSISFINSQFPCDSLIGFEHTPRDTFGLNFDVAGSLIFTVSNRFLNMNSTNSNIPIISAVAPTPPFLRGLNFGNTLDAPNEGDWGIVMQEEHFGTPLS